MQLEEELGVKLFHRSKHSIILTEDGMLLKRRAQEIVLYEKVPEPSYQIMKPHFTFRNGVEVDTRI